MARKASGSGKGAALDKGLKAMFRTVQARPVPEHLRGVIDRLAETSPPTGAKSEEA